MTNGRRKRHNPEQIVRKLRDADAMLNAGKDLAAVLQALEVSESTYARWRSQYGGGLERRLQPLPAAQLTGVRRPSGVRGPLCCFRSGYALTPAQRN